MAGSNDGRIGCTAERLEASVRFGAGKSLTDGFGGWRTRVAGRTASLCFHWERRWSSAPPFFTRRTLVDGGCELRLSLKLLRLSDEWLIKTFAKTDRLQREKSSG